MSFPHAHIVNRTAPLSNHSPLQDDDDDDLDDICPVCESECTCPKKSAAPPVPLPSTSSTTSSLPLAAPPAAAGKRPLKIKLTLPPKLQSHPKPQTTHPGASSAHIGPAPHDAGPSSSGKAAAGAGASAPKRRGRPPKALPTKYNAKKRAAADDMDYKARGTTGTSMLVRRPYHPPAAAPAASTSTADLSDSTLSDYPTFVPAASESTHSSSSESSDTSIDSDTDEEEHFVVHNDEPRHSTKLLPSHVGHRKREKGGGNRWEIRPRKKSVGAGEEEESSSDSGESSEDSSEGGDDEEEEEEEEAEADVEEDLEAIGMVEEDGDLHEETHSRIGVSFPGTGWSDDEEESFDADIFFANLDSDSGASSPEANYASLRAFPGEDVELDNSISTEEEDVLLLMDIDSTVQLRRGDGEFEIGVGLDSLSFPWDRQIFLPDEQFGLPLSLHIPDEDEEMASFSGSEATASWDAATVVLQESDGDTTEDELVDSDGLPNSQAMMLFRWPTTISAIDPLSTLSPSPIRDPPVNASPSTRIALASISMQHRLPPPTPSPADILAGRVSIDDLEDIEMEKMEKKASARVRRRRESGVPIMGEFTIQDVYAGPRTAVVAPGNEVPSFYPRPMRVPRPIEPVCDENMTMQTEVSTHSTTWNTYSSWLC